MQTGTIESANGTPIHVAADTICTHGDNDRALAFVRLLRKTFAEAGIEVAPA